MAEADVRPGERRSELGVEVQAQVPGEAWSIAREEIAEEVVEGFYWGRHRERYAGQSER